jgi:hypothetical protein
MAGNKDILNELMEISPLVAGIGNQTIYTVPAGYFETLGTVISARIAAGGNQEQSLVDVAGKTMPNDVPAGYFDSLAGNILAKIKSTVEEAVAEELKNISSLLAGISKENVYRVPAGYFEQLHESITGVVVTKPQAKLIKAFSRKIMIRYAAAAAVLAAIVFGTTFLLKAPQLDEYVKEGLKTYNSETKINEALAQVNTEDIYNYLQMTSDIKDTELISGIDEDETETGNETETTEDALLNSILDELEIPANEQN